MKGRKKIPALLVLAATGLGLSLHAEEDIQAMTWLYIHACLNIHAIPQNTRHTLHALIITLENSTTCSELNRLESTLCLQSSPACIYTVTCSHSQLICLDSRLVRVIFLHVISTSYSSKHVINMTF